MDFTYKVHNLIHLILMSQFYYEYNTCATIWGPSEDITVE